MFILGSEYKVGKGRMTCQAGSLRDGSEQAVETCRFVNVFSALAEAES